jgi:hypothetical protein
MGFESAWLNWSKESNQGDGNEADSSVSSVSSLETQNALKTDKKERKYIKKGMPYCQNSEISTDLCIQSTDKTDKTRNLDGHRVARVVWETPSAVVFQDEVGKFWRYLHSFKLAWPVVVEGKA